MPENRRKARRTGPVPNSEATRFRPGQSGNPGGRPRYASLSTACRELLESPVPGDPEGRSYAQAIADVLAERALGGDIRAAQELADRAEGKATQRLDMQATSKDTLTPEEMARARAVVEELRAAQNEDRGELQKPHQLTSRFS